MIFATFLLVVLVAGVCWLTALYDLDRRPNRLPDAAEGGAGPVGEGEALIVLAPSLGAAGPVESPEQHDRAASGEPDLGGPHPQQNAPSRTPCRDAARRDA